MAREESRIMSAWVMTFSAKGRRLRDEWEVLFSCHLGGAEEERSTK